MSDADILEMLGYLWLAYMVGWCGGKIFLTFGQITDKV